MNAKKEKKRVRERKFMKARDDLNEAEFVQRRYKYLGLLFVICLLYISRAKNFLTTTPAHYTNTQLLPAAKAFFLCDCVLNIASHHIMHNGRTNIQSMQSCKFDT